MTHVENATDMLIIEVKRKNNVLDSEAAKPVTSPVRKTAKIEISPKINSTVSLNTSSVKQTTVTKLQTEDGKTEQTRTKALHQQGVNNKQSTAETSTGERRFYGGRPQTNNSTPKGFHSIRFQPSTIVPGIKAPLWSATPHKQQSSDADQPQVMTSYKKTTTTTTSRVRRTNDDCPDVGIHLSPKKQFTVTNNLQNGVVNQVWSPAATTTPVSAPVARTWTPPISNENTVLKEIKMNNVETNTWTTPIVHKPNTIEISFAAPGDATLMTLDTENDIENTSPIPPAPPTPPLPESASLKNGDDKINDPSVILRNLQAGIPVNPKEIKTQVSVDADVHPEDVRKACKTISDLLLFPTNKNTKGARMFAKRRKRSAKWTLESVGQGPDETVTTTTEVFEEVTTTGPSGGVSMFPPGFIPLPPPELPPVRKLIIEPIDFNVNLKDKEKCRHDLLPPERCNILVQDLTSQTGRGAQMFEKRRKRSEKYVVPEKPTMTAPQVVLKKSERDEPLNVSLEFIAMQGKTAPVSKPKITPWEAASQDPKGRVDAAFDYLNTSTKPIEFTKKFEKPKPPASWMQSSTIVPDFRPKKSGYTVARPTFKADEVSTDKPTTNGELPPRFQPKFDARNTHNDVNASPGSSRINFRPNPRSWTSPDSTPGIISPPLSESSITNEFKPNAGLPTVPHKVPNFNSKPRGFRSPTQHDSPTRDYSSPTSAVIVESDDL
ncbi:uncharacterized protein [Antedon mediterranea]